jgi:hypothetical protein
MKKLLTDKIVEQDMKCGICGEPFTDCCDIVPDHIRAKAWDHRREMIIQITFRQPIGDAISRRDRGEGSEFWKSSDWIK